MPGLKGWRPTRIHALRALVVLGCLVVLWHTQVTKAMIVRPRASQARAEWWSLAAWAAHAVLLAAGVALLGERVSGRLVAASTLILGGVALAMLRRRARPQ